jgi:CDP-diacylglycerol--glycerol-3-phosphate 3-phosphatidyltransferase
VIENLKPFYNNTLRPVAKLFLRIGLHPNHVTILGLLLFVGAGWLAAVGLWFWSLGAVIAGACMDGIDGLLARESGKMSMFGAILDSSFDRLTEMALLGGVLVYYLRSGMYGLYGPVLCFSALSFSVMVSYVKARCEGAGISCNRGILQRPERIVLFCAGLCFGHVVMIWMLSAITLLSCITFIQRLLQAASAGS